MITTTQTAHNPDRDDGLDEVQPTEHAASVGRTHIGLPDSACPSIGATASPLSLGSNGCCTAPAGWPWHVNGHTWKRLTERAILLGDLVNTVDHPDTRVPTHRGRMLYRKGAIDVVVHPASHTVISVIDHTLWLDGPAAKSSPRSLREATNVQEYAR